MSRFTTICPFFVSTLLICCLVSCQDAPQEHAGHVQDDHHLHESQIPPSYEQPSETDIKTMLTNVFKNIDSNTDEHVDQEELKKYLDKLHEMLIDESVNQQWVYYQPPIQEVHSWESYDPEKREALPWDHYLNYTYTEEVLRAYREGANIDEWKSEDPNFRGYYTMLKRADVRWKTADKNNDTVLVKEEFRYFLHPEEAEHTKHLIVEESMDDMDADKNKEISLEEYIQHMKDVTPEQDKQDLAAFSSHHQSQFEIYLDKDKDGNLSVKEMTEWLLPGFDRHEAEAARMIQETDGDQDQKLNKDELLKNYNYYLSLIPAEMWREFTSANAAGGSTTPAAGQHDEF